jgi:hypothetical protein
VEGFFLDACVLLPHPLEAMSKACTNFLKEAASLCFLSSSVRKEAFDLIEQSHDIIIVNLHDKLKPFFEANKIEKLTNKDGKIIADFFSEQKSEIKRQSHKRSNIPNEILGAVENFVATSLHSLEDGEKLSITDFLAALTTELAIIKHSLEAPFKGIKLVDITPNDSIRSAIIISIILTNLKDADHLSSALEHQFRQNKWIIFVTTDDTHILSKEPSLREIFLQCSKPEWAFDYYRDITKRKSPMQHVREMKTYTNRQKQIINAMEKAIGFKIIDETK